MRATLNEGEVMPVCIPLSSIHNMEDFLDIVNREGEVVITQGGRSAFRCMRENISEQRASHSELEEQINLALQEVRAGKYSSMRDFLKTL